MAKYTGCSGTALDCEDRVQDEMQGQAVTIDFHRHRIDQEWHVVVDDLDDGVRRLPAVFLHGRIEHAYPGMAGFALARKTPVRQGGAVEIAGLAFGQVLGIDLSVITRDERFERSALVGGDLRAHELQNLVQLR